MECFYCRSYNRKYYCCRCLTEKLTDHNDELKAITAESKQAIQEAETHLEKTSTIHALVVDKKQRSNNIGRLVEDQKRTLRESDIMTQQVERLRKVMDQRRKNLEQGRQSLQQAQQALIQSSTVKDTNGDRTLATATAAVHKSWLRTYKMTAKTRQILVKEAASLFDLKLGVVEDGDDDALHTSPLTRIGGTTSFSNSSDHYQPSSSSTDTHPNITSSSNNHTADDSQPSMDETNTSYGNLQNSTMAFTKSNRANGKVQSFEDLYICGVTLPARLIDVSRYPKEELNSAIGYTTQMLDLVVRYLGIKLPFCLFRKDIYTYIRSIPHSRLYQNQSKMPLFLEDDKNFRRFLIGVSMLNYNIAYLCFTQGIHVPLSQVANTLQNLMACCKAPGLGFRRSHAMIYQGLTNLDFTFDFNQVLRQTALRYRCGSRTTLRGQQGLANKQDRTERYFKVRRSAFLGDHYHDNEDENDDPFDLTDDDDDDDDDYDDDDDDDDDDDEDDDDDADKDNRHRPHKYQSRRRQQQEEDRQDETTSSSNENWNLVDVMPAFATQSGQNDSIFHHLGAAHLGATLMPGVLGMMENLGNVGGRHASNHSGSSSTFRIGETDEPITNHPRTSLQRRW